MAETRRNNESPSATTAELTSEQRERIRKNRERALALRRQREQAAYAVAKTEITNSNDNTRTKNQNPSITADCIKKDTNDDDDMDSLEDFEIGASDYVTKQQAKNLYCLPEGTLAVCKIVQTKTNPRNPHFGSMKLYDRTEIRKRAHQRHGGKRGLQQERQRRQEALLEKDLQDTKNIFQSKSNDKRKTKKQKTR